MNKVLIVSEDDELILNLKKILCAQFQVLEWNTAHPDHVPDLILIAAREHFSELLTAQARIDHTYVGIPVLFLWVEEEYLRFLTYNDLMQVGEKTIPRSSDHLLEYIASHIPTSSGTSQNTHCLTEIQSGIHKDYLEKNSGGALRVEYDSFTSIYQFVEQLAERTGQYVQSLLLTLTPHIGAAPSKKALETAMSKLSDSVQMTLRKNDVLTGCGEAQMLILLMDADDDGGHLAANRIYNTFLGLYDEAEYDLLYDIRPLGKHKAEKIPR